MNTKTRYLFLIFLFIVELGFTEQLLLFDRVFSFEEKDAIPTKSHLKLMASELGDKTPINWVSPVNYAEGKVYVRLQVLEKPAGDEKTHWSLCYIANKGQNGSSYACASSPHYKEEGNFEVIRDMNKLWQRDKVVWSEGLKAFTLVTKASKSHSGVKGKAHAHLQPDLKKFFPTKLRVTMIQIAKGSSLDRSKIPD